MNYNLKTVRVDISVQEKPIINQVKESIMKIKIGSSHSVSISVIPASRLSLVLAIAAIKEIALKFREIKEEVSAIIALVVTCVSAYVDGNGRFLYAVFRETFSSRHQGKGAITRDLRKIKERRENRSRSQGESCGRLSLFRASEVMGALG